MIVAGAQVSDESLLEIAERHVLEGAARVARQRELIAKLRVDGRSTVAAAELLAIFEEVQTVFEQDLARIKNSLK